MSHKRNKMQLVKNTIYFIPPFKLNFLVGCTLYYTNIAKGFLQHMPQEGPEPTVPLPPNSPLGSSGCLAICHQ